MTDETAKRLVDDLVEAAAHCRSPSLAVTGELLKNVREEIESFVTDSELREQQMLSRQAQERDDFAREELKKQLDLKEVEADFMKVIEIASATYTERFNALTAYLKGETAGGTELTMVFQGEKIGMGFEFDPAANIRKALSGEDRDDGAEVTTKLDEHGRLVTRIRRGLAAQPEDLGGVQSAEPEALDFSADANEKEA